MKTTGTPWRVDDEGRLLTPDGAFVALFQGGVIFFYDRKRGTYTPFALSDWWVLMSKEIDVPDSPPDQAVRKSAGSWEK